MILVAKGGFCCSPTTLLATKFIEYRFFVQRQKFLNPILLKIIFFQNRVVKLILNLMILAKTGGAKTTLLCKLFFENHSKLISKLIIICYVD